MNIQKVINSVNIYTGNFIILGEFKSFRHLKSMGGKRKVKQREKVIKKENPNSKNQILLQHYFPNLCENKSKTYQNALKKPNGVMK